MKKNRLFAPAYLAEAMDASMHAAQQAGALMQTADNAQYAGRTVRVHDTELLNFACCSYLGLELRPDLQESAIGAIRRFGTQFPFPRAMLQSPLYEELSESLGRMTGGHVVVAASTTLGHIAALPVLIEPSDAVVIDIAAHASLHTAVALLRGIHVEPLRHNRADLLEKRVRALSAKHRRVWYVLDGLYSILGEFAPIDELRELLKRCPSLHLYVDDAHSTSWTGTHGRGYGLEKLEDRERVVVALSLNKAFSAGGGALVLPDRKMADRILRAGGPMVFSGALQPAQLGAAVASARLHLSDELGELQKELQAKLSLTVLLAQDFGVPLGDETLSPIFFLPCKSEAKTFEVVRLMRERGIGVTAAMYPIVPRNQAGIRFCITLHNHDADIRLLMEGFAEAADQVGLETEAKSGLFPSCSPKPPGNVPPARQA